MFNSYIIPTEYGSPPKPKIVQPPDIQQTEKKQVIGMYAEMSLAEDQTADLWRRFMPRRKEIEQSLSSDVYDIQVYPPGFRMDQFTPQTRFTKWVAVEVASWKHLPEGMEQLTLPGGIYAVFVHRGPAHTFPRTAQYIFGEWLPASGYELDDRPHFNLLSEDYLGLDHPDSEEEVWVPVRK